jgi:hypothetical protein
MSVFKLKPRSKRDGGKFACAVKEGHLEEVEAILGRNKGFDVNL